MVEVLEEKEDMSDERLKNQKETQKKEVEWKWERLEEIQLKIKVEAFKQRPFIYFFDVELE